MKLDWKTCIKLGVTLFCLYLGIHYWPNISGLGISLLHAGSALLTGCAMAYLLNILMSLYERYYFPASRSALVEQSRRPVCILAAIFSLVALLFLVVRLVLPELVACVRLLIAEVPSAIKQLVAGINDSGLLTSTAMEDFFLSLEGVNWQEKITQMVRLLLDGVGGAAQMALSTFSSVISVLMNLVIGLIFAIYLLVSKEQLSRQFSRLMRRYLRPSWDRRLRYVLSTLNTCFHKFIVGQCTEAVILGLLCMAGMTLFQFPYAVMIGTLVGFTALIPVAGAYIGAAVGAFMILTVSPLKALGFLVFIVVLQQLEGNLIYPKVVGTSIGLPGIWVLATVTLAGGILGIPGMLLGVPTAAAVYQILRQDVNKHLS